MFDIGASLREARESRGLSLDDAQKSLRIRERYLNALESEGWELLPGDAYARGFLRTYAEFLGLDGSLLVDEFNERVAVAQDEPIVPESLAPRGGRSTLLTRTIVGVLALGLVVVVAAAWRPGSPAAPIVAAPAAAATPKRVLPLGMPVAPVILPKREPAIARILVPKGQSWLSIRRGGPAGREIFRGFLGPGHGLTYSIGRKVWLRIGRPHAVVVTLDGRRVRGLPKLPANLLLTRSGPAAG